MGNGYTLKGGNSVIKCLCILVDKRSTLEGKNLLPFLEGALFTGKPRGNPKSCLPLKNGGKMFQLYPFPFVNKKKNYPPSLQSYHSSQSSRHSSQTRPKQMGGPCLCGLAISVGGLSHHM